MYGYIRVAGNATVDAEIVRIQCELAEYASREGFALDQVFTETVGRSDPAFTGMIDALKRNDIKDIIVPSLWHFASLPGLQDAMRLHIERETGARIWVAQGRRQ
jgi:hypothetical protein